MKYLVIKCTELGDQWECDADREPICVIDDYTAYNKGGYEIYLINEDGTLKKIRNYDEIAEEYIVYCEYANDDFTPSKIVRLKDGDKTAITKSDIANWRQKFNFTASTKTIKEELSWIGAYGEEIKGIWCVIGEARDNSYPTAC